MLHTTKHAELGDIIVGRHISIAKVNRCRCRMKAAQDTHLVTSSCHLNQQPLRLKLLTWTYIPGYWLCLGEIVQAYPASKPWHAGSAFWQRRTATAVYFWVAAGLLLPVGMILDVITGCHLVAAPAGLSEATCCCTVSCGLWSLKPQQWLAA